MYYARKTESGPLRYIGLGSVILINALVALGLATGLGKTLVTRLTETEVVIIEEEVLPDEEPPPPPPVDVELPPPPPQVVLPEFTFDQPPPPNAIRQVEQVAKPAPRPEVRPAPPKADVRVNPSRRRNGTLPEYPSAALRAKEEGLSGLSLCVDDNGRVTDVKLISSSGSKRLDDAALDWAKRERFNPGTINSAKSAMCNYILEYKWELPR